jgi:invasion protein IalB
VSLFLAAGVYVGLAAAIGVGPIVSAQDTPAEDATADDAVAPDYPTTSNPGVYDDWNVRCSGEDGVATVCETYRNLYLTDNNQRILHIAIGHVPDEDSAVGIFIAPLGVSLPEGMMIAIDEGEASEFAYRSCGTDGCRARAPMSTDMLNTMRAGSEMRVTIAEVTGRRIVIPVSLTGFTAAFAASDIQQ